MEPLPDEVLARIPGWEGRAPHAERLATGWSNANYRIRVGSEVFVLRVADPLCERMGVDRAREQAAARAAAQAGIGPEIVAFLEPEGHMLTRFIEGRTWGHSETRPADEVERVARRVLDVHALPLLDAAFCPFRAIESYVAQTRALGGTLPPGFERHAGRLRGAEVRLRDDAWPVRFCHHDLSPANFIDDGEIRILDWEYAAPGDPFFDLATLVTSHGYDDAEETRMLETYLGRAPSLRERARLDDMKLVYDMREATWSLLRFTLTDPEAPLAAKLRYSADIFFGRLDASLAGGA